MIKTGDISVLIQLLKASMTLENVSGIPACYFLDLDNGYKLHTLSKMSSVHNDAHAYLEHMR